MNVSRFVVVALTVAVAATSLGGCNTSGSATAPASRSVGADAAPLTPTGSPAELTNQILPDPCPPYGSGPCPTNFEVVYKGNLSSEIPASQPLYGHFNAFCPPSYGPPSGPYCPPYISYGGTPATTTVTFGGPQSTYGTTMYQNSSHPNDVHFALMAGAGHTGSLNSLEQSAEWTFVSGPPVPTPIVSVNWRDQKKHTKSAKWQYAIVYVGASTNASGPSTYGAWTAVPYVPAGAGQAAANQPRMVFANYGTQVIYVQTSGIVTGVAVAPGTGCVKEPDCAANMQILGTLDDEGYPPPGTSGSPFAPLKYPPPHVLKPQK